MFTDTCGKMTNSFADIATDTFTFVQEINNLPMFGKLLISFDVESLFTNIPLEECIDLAAQANSHATSSMSARANS